MKIQIANNQTDFFNCMQIRTDVFVLEQNVDPSLELDEYDQRSIHFIVYEEGPIATARLLVKDDVGKVGRVAVIKSWRGKNVGFALMEAIEDYARKIKLKKLTLGAQLTAIPFYEKLGYIAHGDEFLDANILHRQMDKII